ncbi:MAG: 50S ribosome-binding GTPase [Deltaproteobacteria bacterium]|nr:50S ribosome-binding GTPase [Deltaproteobacteria bacterium]
MNIVVLGHVDHGKSTLIGRLLADTQSLPKGKLDTLKKNCAKQGRPFEYAYLLDALKDEQAQGITIDSARCFFKTGKRDYIIIDAPGHIEFLKNMISGASRAEAALILIDAREGIQENSRRHGYLVSLLGISQVVVCINKMDLIHYDPGKFDALVEEYKAFLARITVRPKAFIPISALEGENVVSGSPHLSWFDGPSVLETIEHFSPETVLENLPLRFPVQDVYKFSENGALKRILAGSVKTGQIHAGDKVIFWPSQKEAAIHTIEDFTDPNPSEVSAGRATGLTLTTEVYVEPGQMMSRVVDPQPKVTDRFRANLFWMGREPMVEGKQYKLKHCAARIPVWLSDIHQIIDASSLKIVANKREIGRHDVAECVLQTMQPLAFDLASEIMATGRFVIVDEYDISGGGIILEALPSFPALQPSEQWIESQISYDERAIRMRHKSGLIIFTGSSHRDLCSLAQKIEKLLFDRNVYAYHESDSNLKSTYPLPSAGKRCAALQNLKSKVYSVTHSGQLFLTVIPELDPDEKELLRHNMPAAARLIVLEITEQQTTLFMGDRKLSLLDNEQVANEIYKCVFC